MKPRELPSPGFVPDADRFFIGPKNCPSLKERMTARTRRLALLEQNPFNVLERGDPDLALIAVGGVYPEVRKRYPTATVLRLRLAYPLAEPDVLRLLDHVASRNVLVFEDGDPIVTGQLQQLASHLGIRVERGSIRPEAARRNYSCRLCPACPHRATLHALKDLGKTVAGDAGCSALASLAPLESVHVHTAMGASIATAAGMASFSGREVVALIGDAAFFHSGINALVDVVDSGSDLLVLILDNGCAALTGGQPTVSTVDRSSATGTDWKALLHGLGVGEEALVVVTEVYDYHAIRSHIAALSARTGTNVLVVRGRCTYTLVELDALVSSHETKATVRHWERRCTDCAAIVREEKEVCFVAAELCGACTICEALNTPVQVQFSGGRTEAGDGGARWGGRRTCSTNRK